MEIMEEDLGRERAMAMLTARGNRINRRAGNEEGTHQPFEQDWHVHEDAGMNFIQARGGWTS